MSIAFKKIRLTRLAQIKPLSSPQKRLYQASKVTPLTMNSATSAYQTSHHPDGGNAGAAPKQMSQINHLKLNDGNEVPTVWSHLAHAYIFLAHPGVAGLRTWDSELQGRSQFSPG
jgi:hypothetical protein